MSPEIAFRLDKLKESQQSRISPVVSQEQKEKDRSEILALNPSKVLVVCYAGVFRSGLVTEILNLRGYEAVNIGVNKDLAVGCESDNEDASDPYDAIITMTSFTKYKYIEQIRQIQKHNDKSQIPIRVIGIPESTGFHTNVSVDREKLIMMIENKLDDLGFVDKINTISKIEKS